MSAIAINTPEPIRTLISRTTSYSVQATLGEGTYGKVVKCLKEDTKEMVAVKVLKQKYCKDTEQEAAMLQYLSCVDQDQYHLVKLHEKFECRGNTCLAFEMLDISLWDLLISQDCKPLGLNTIRQIAQQLLIALNVLECLGVLHMDIKPDNIMVANRDDSQINIKLIDFGLAKRAGEIPLGTMVQPIGYRAPEIYLGQPITESIDVWGVGCVLAFLFTGLPLFPVHCEYQNMKYVVETLGMPDKELLDSGGYTHYFFIQEQGPNGPSWRFMTHKEFESASSIRPEMMDPLIPRLKSLDDLINLHPASSESELWDRSLFVDLLKHLLHVDWKQRTTARQALQHQFFQRTYQSPPDSHGLSNSESLCLSSDGAQAVVSSPSKEESGFWCARAPVSTPCADQASPDGVDVEMGNQEVVSSSSEEEFGFWKTCAPIPAPCADQARPDGVDGETGDMVTNPEEALDINCSHLSSSLCEDTEYSTSEDDEGYGTDKEDNDHDRENSDDEDLDENREIFLKNSYVLWDMYCACLARSLGADSGLFDRSVSPISPRQQPEVSERGLKTGSGVCSFDGHLRPGYSDEDLCSKSSEEDASPPDSPDTLGHSNNESLSLSSDEAQEVVSSSSEEELGFWCTRAPVPMPCADQASPDDVGEEMGDMVANPEEALDIGCSHLSPNLSEDTGYITSEDNKAQEVVSSSSEVDLSAGDHIGANIITTQPLWSPDEGTQSFTEDGVFSARGADQIASPAEALATPNWKKRVMKRIRKSCRQLATAFCFYPRVVEV